MKHIGAHVSIAGGVEKAPERAHAIGARAFGMFVKNQRQWFAKPLSEENIALFNRNCKEYGFSKRFILPHAGYLINLGTTDPVNAEKSLNSFIDEINRCRQLGIGKINVHPGAHLNRVSESECIEIIASNINRALDATGDVCVVIENTAGDGTHLGYRFEQIKAIIELIHDQSRIGVCIDTCHLFAAGYDIRTYETYKNTWEEFDRIIGFNWLKGMHLNDSKNDLGSRVDRHESLGRGYIGMEAFKMIARDERLEEIPLILETPNPEIWPDEIKMLYEFSGG